MYQAHTPAAATIAAITIPTIVVVIDVCTSLFFCTKIKPYKKAVHITSYHPFGEYNLEL